LRGRLTDASNGLSLNAKIFKCAQNFQEGSGERNANKEREKESPYRPVSAAQTFKKVDTQKQEQGESNQIAFPVCQTKTEEAEDKTNKSSKEFKRFLSPTSGR